CNFHTMHSPGRQTNRASPRMPGCAAARMISGFYRVKQQEEGSPLCQNGKPSRASTRARANLLQYIRNGVNGGTRKGESASRKCQERGTVDASAGLEGGQHRGHGQRQI